MSNQQESTYIPYEESNYPAREKRVREESRSRNIPLPQDYTLKRCEAYVGIEEQCGAPARWVRIRKGTDEMIRTMAVCEGHRTQEEATTMPLQVEGERVITHEYGNVLYFLTMQDDVVGTVTIQVWLNQENGKLFPMVTEEIPSPAIEHLRERKAQREQT